MPDSGHPLPLSPYSAFDRLPDSDLREIQVKVTYVGPSISHRWRPSAFAVAADRVDVKRFRPFWRKRVYYDDESWEPKVFTVTTSEMRDVLTRVGSLPVVPEGGVDSTENFSFGIEGYAAGEDRVFESILNRSHAVSLFVALLEALSSNSRGTAEVRDMACWHGALEGTPPVEVTDQAHVVFGLDSLSGGTARVTNTGTTSWKAPVLLMVEIDNSNVRAIDAAFETCIITPYGRPYYVLSVGKSLAPGETVTQSIRIKNSENEAFHLTGRVFAGPGIP
jgi:hypothetical protein